MVSISPDTVFDLGFLFLPRNHCRSELAGLKPPQAAGDPLEIRLHFLPPQTAGENNGVAAVETVGEQGSPGALHLKSSNLLSGHRKHKEDHP